MIIPTRKLYRAMMMASTHVRMAYTPNLVQPSCSDPMSQSPRKEIRLQI